ncbi:hypothetical protein [Legionella sp.]|uniref:hypothetical protein n=1 Tax=Legionella sp. TaxID=459 RepID=UPI003CB8BD97
MQKEKFNPPKKTFFQIEETWKALQGFDAKNKIKYMRIIAHDILVSYDRNAITAKQWLNKSTTKNYRFIRACLNQRRNSIS